MKKTFLSIGATLVVIGIANAGIKETCLEHPDKLVWVEKTQRCIPINPCASDDEKIQKVYCFPVDANSGEIIYSMNHFPNEIDLDMVIDKYVQAVLKTAVIEKIDLGKTGVVEGFNFDNGYRERAIGIKTADGGYFAMRYTIRSYNGTPDVLDAASVAYGRYGFNSDGDRDILYFSVEYMNEELCKDIVNFASRLSGYEKISFKSYDSENYRCIVSHEI